MTIYETYTPSTPSNADPSGGTIQANYGSGYGNSLGTSSANAFVMLSANKPIENIYKYFECFSKNNGTYKVIVNVDQPTPQAEPMPQSRQKQGMHS